nr:MAG TPA: hypothetical protein [Microviridae sp.]
MQNINICVDGDGTTYAQPCETEHATNDVYDKPCFPPFVIAATHNIILCIVLIVRESNNA